MGGMDISSRLEFAAAPGAVHQMMTTPAWLDDLVSRTDATEHTTTVAGDTTRVEMTVPAPAEVARFAGSGLRLVQEVQWGPAAADGSREGTLHVTSPGLPVDMTGHATLAPGGRGTVVEYTGQLTVNIPFVGKKVEQQAAPYVKDAIDAQQVAGDEWLAAHAG